MLLKSHAFNRNLRSFRTSSALCGWSQTVAVGYGIPVPNKMGSGYKFLNHHDFLTPLSVNIYTTGRLLRGGEVYGPFKRIFDVISEDLIPDINLYDYENFTEEYLSEERCPSILINIIKINRTMNSNLLEHINKEHLIDNELDKLLVTKPQKEIQTFLESLTSLKLNTVKEYYGYYVIDVG